MLVLAWRWGGVASVPFAECRHLCSLSLTVKFKDKAEMLNKMARGKVESKARGKAEGKIDDRQSRALPTLTSASDEER